MRARQGKHQREQFGRRLSGALGIVRPSCHCSSCIAVHQWDKAAGLRLMLEGEDSPVDGLANNEDSRWLGQTSQAHQATRRHNVFYKH